MQEDKDAKIIMDLMGQADPTRSDSSVKKPRAPRKPKLNQILAPTPGVIHVAGNGNVVALGNVTHNVTHNYHQPVRPRVVVKTGDGVLDTKQKDVILRLKTEWVNTHNAIKPTKLTYPAAGGRLNRAMKVNSYAELKTEQFEAACNWLRRQTVILKSKPSAAKKVPDLRKKQIGAIKARCINQLGDEFFYVPYIVKNFDKSSLADLDMPELERTYRYIISKKV